jgi:hypothetical protein
MVADPGWISNDAPSNKGIGRLPIQGQVQWKSSAKSRRVRR